MPKYKFPLTNGKTLTLEGDTQPGDADVEAAAKEAGVTVMPADGQFSVKEFAALPREDQARVRDFNMKAQEGKDKAPGLLSAAAEGMRSGPESNPLSRGWMAAGPDTLSQGVGKLKQGRIIGGTADLVKGTMGTIAPVALPFALGVAPVATVGGLVGGAVGDYGARKGAEALGAGEDLQNAAGVVGGLAGGATGAEAAQVGGAAAGNALVARAARLRTVPAMDRYAPGYVASKLPAPFNTVAGPLALAQNPGVNQMVGNALIRGTGGTPAPSGVLPVTRGRTAPVVKPPPSLNDQLGVSPTSTGAIMDSLPNTAQPETGVLPVAPALAAKANEAAASAHRSAAADLGVSETTPPLTQEALSSDAGPQTPLEPARPRIPVPPVQEVNTVKGKAVPPRSDFSGLAQELQDRASMKAEAGRPAVEPDTTHVPEAEHHAASGAPEPVSAPADAGRAARIGESNAGADSLDQLLTATHGEGVDLPPNGGGQSVADRDALLKALDENFPSAEPTSPAQALADSLAAKNGQTAAEAQAEADAVTAKRVAESNARRQAKKAKTKK